MTTFVLVHGSFHGAWCWSRVAELLVAAGHTVTAIDLPGHGADRSPLAAQTLDTYVACVSGAIDAHAEPVVLVGHSMGGVVVTQTAERRPEKVRALAYVCAFLPRDGQSLLDLARTDDESLLVKNLVIDEAAGLHWVLEDAQRDVFYHDCPDEDAARAKRLVVREPLAPVSTPVRISEAAFGRIPRTYVECLDDRAMGPALQRRMVGATPCRVVSMRSGHSPFFSAPSALAAHLMSI